MPVNRFYKGSPFSKGEIICLEDQELHHLSHVVRVREGETVEIVNGQGQIATATVISVGKKRADLELLSLEDPPPPLFKSVLALAIPRINRLDTIIEKGTELGMSTLLLFPGKSSEKKEIFENQLYRLKTIAIGAMKQSGRPYLPEIILSPPLSKWKHFPEHSFYGDVSKSAPLFFEAWQQMPPVKEATFFIGPESGFSEEEIARLKKENAVGVSLNGNILRTDTAAIAALALLQHLAILPTK